VRILVNRLCQVVDLGRTEEVLTDVVQLINLIMSPVGWENVFKS